MVFNVASQLTSHVDDNPALCRGPHRDSSHWPPITFFFFSLFTSSNEVRKIRLSRKKHLNAKRRGRRCEVVTLDGCLSHDEMCRDDTRRDWLRRRRTQMKFCWFDDLAGRFLKFVDISQELTQFEINCSIQRCLLCQILLGSDKSFFSGN